jgi:tryptophan synthase beta chain
VGPEHAYWHDTGRVTYDAIDDDQAIAAFGRVARLEGILPALETAHAFAYAFKLAPTLPADAIIIVNCSGRGDKDCQEVARLMSRR